MKQHTISLPTLLIFIVTLLLLSGCGATQSGIDYKYSPTANPLNKVVHAQSEAFKQNKLLLVVLGAQWCHDSTGLAKRFSSNEMQRILTPHYETVFVDVGMLEDRRNITERFNYPIYYATPTVM
ncbi:MAG: thioredoxin family protein, partial [Pseudomonadota bacterium]|nr:thioredoxin family protein [Pseudomonadota bacterium]